MVAPLVVLLCAAYRLDPDDGAWLPAISRSWQWLRAFGGPQPHPRLYQIGVRHWDGFWFGRSRMWGDVFPHYWSVLTANALLALPDELRTAETDSEAQIIYRANLANFYDDGSATCAYVFPSAVDGVPGDFADSLSNDQDWALVWMLRNMRGSAGR